MPVVSSAGATEQGVGVGWVENHRARGGGEWRAMGGDLESHRAGRSESHQTRTEQLRGHWGENDK